MLKIEKRILRRILRQPRYIPDEVRINKRCFKYCDSRTFIDGYKEIFLKEVYAFNSDNDSPYIIDCGSNIGLSIFYFKQRFPNSKILAFEADKSIFNILEHNILEYKLKDVVLNNSAVWVEDGFINFCNEGGFSGRIIKPGDSVFSIVPSVKLSSIINSQVDLLKLDIEGAEAMVVKSIEPKLRFVDKIFIEYHSHVSESQELNIILEILSRNGFRYYIKEAYVSEKPFLEVKPLAGMDLQLNIYAIKF
jgi:FkbM family methyltransferase